MIESTIDPVYRAKSDLAEFQASFDLTDNLTLASETGYNADMIWSMQDYNRFTTAPHAFNENYTFPSIRRPGLFEEGGVFCDPQLGCSDRVLAADLSTAESRNSRKNFVCRRTSTASSTSISAQTSCATTPKTNTTSSSIR